SLSYVIWTRPNLTSHPCKLEISAATHRSPKLHSTTHPLLIQYLTNPALASSQNLNRTASTATSAHISSDMGRWKQLSFISTYGITRKFCFATKYRMRLIFSFF